MTIVYSCITCGSIVLCSSGSDNREHVDIDQMVQSVLPILINRPDGKHSVTIGSYKVHCIVDKPMIYICLAPTEFPISPCYVFLTVVKDQFKSSKLYNKAFNARQHEFDRKLRRLLNKLMDKYSNPEAGDQLYLLHDKVEEVTAVMLQNIEGVMQRQLEDLVIKTAQVKAASESFRRNASRVKNAARKRNIKICLIILFFVLLSVGLFILFGTDTINF